MRSFEVDMGDVMYFDKDIRCECCKESKGRTNFLQFFKDTDGRSRHRALRVCSDCRGIVKKVNKEVSWGGRTKSKNGVSRPSYIDWMEENAKKGL